jgi:hypothetical protein
MDRDLQEMLASSLRRVLADKSDLSLVERLADLGWDEVLADDRPTALRTLFEIRGETLSTADALGPLLAQTLADTLGQPQLSNASVVLPITGRPPGQTSRDTVVVDGPVVVDGIVLARPSPGTSLVIPVGEGPALRLAVVEGGQAEGAAPAGGGPVGLAFRDVSPIDDEQTFGQVTGAVDGSSLTWIDGASAGWEAAVTAGRWAVAAELVGIGRHVILEAVDYTKQRKQYGRPIGTFQALQHRLASAYTSVVGAGQVVVEAASSGSPWAALVAKALAGHAAEDSCTQSQQAYGAIGFTWEHSFHRYLRRTYALDRLFGDWRTLEFEIGQHLQQQRQVPRIGTL